VAHVLELLSLASCLDIERYEYDTVVISNRLTMSAAYLMSCSVCCKLRSHHPQEPRPREIVFHASVNGLLLSWQGDDLTADWSLPISVLVWVRSFIEPDLFENNVPFDNTTPIYLINLLWKLWLENAC